MFEEPAQPEPRTRPDFDAWVEYCFVHGYRDWANWHNDPFEVADARETEFVWSIDPVVLAEHMIRLFESPAFIADRYSDEQIARAVWFFFSQVSSYFHEIRDCSAIPEPLRDRCIRSVATIYTDLFDRVCGKGPDDSFLGKRDYCKAIELLPDLDGAIYMIWDMDSFAYAAIRTDEVDAAFERGYAVLEAALMRCKTSACRLSALHGIGHSVRMFEESPKNDRLRALVDRFLAECEVPGWLAEYADCARFGAVQ
ncbi:MAG: hypothetical protein EA423_03405 [Phycisphaerales bacterium]|nr:MAG: hypothetical protein EA423_03405 [Phycisphaerales bacterium]